MSSAKSTESATGRAGWAALLPAGFHVGWVIASYLLLAFVVWMSLRPGLELPPISKADKFGHALAYWTLATWFMGFHVRERRWTVALSLLVFGAALELAQQWMGLGRTGDPADMVANGLGVAAGMLLSPLTRAWPRRVERLLGRT
jgi:VanZ family protein